MSDRSDAVLVECENDARFGAAEDNPIEWSGSLPDRGCDYLDNFCLFVPARTLVQSIDEDSFWLYPLSLLPELLNRLNNQ